MSSASGLVMASSMQHPRAALATPARLLALQRTAGNAATQRALAAFGLPVQRGGGPVAPPTAAVETGRVGFVREEGLNLRAGPDRASTSFARLKFGQRVHILSDPDPQPGWLRVTILGLVGYVSAPRVHFAPDWLMRKDPALTMIRVKTGQNFWGLVKETYGIQGNEGSADQNINHFINAVRAVNKPDAFRVRTGLLDKIGNFLISGRSASDTELIAGVDIWIPSFGVAASMDVGSGTVTGEVARIVKKVKQKIEDFGAACWASGKYIPDAIAHHAGEVGSALIGGLIDFAKDAAKILAVSTAVGALIGALFGGVGAAPGAVIGFEIGLLILQYYGLYLLIEAILGIAGQLIVRLGQFVALVWNANGDRKQIEQAGKTLADALGILVSAALVAFAAYVLKKGGKAISQTKFAKTVGQQPLARWLADRQRMTTTKELLDKGKKPTPDVAPAAKVTPKVGDSLQGLMKDSKLTPSQTTVKLELAKEYAARMGKPGGWNWNDPINKIILDANGNIMSGHHRVVAAELAGIKIPESGIHRSKTLQIPEKVRSWSDVTFK